MASTEFASPMAPLTPPTAKSPSPVMNEDSNDNSLSMEIPPVGESSKNGRQLSNTKRAAQNRAAQRAFRQRKECYIKDLETKVRELKTSKAIVDSLHQENLQLRDYILALQSRLIEQSGVADVPPPPAVFARRQITFLRDQDDDSLPLPPDPKDDLAVSLNPNRPDRSQP
ncbi:uncharacterized protein V1516DRAFT_673551 [Lipomyces oligophaga]|uniref:uncharacterized protein n=1 Tax=Lipomyces oligophaga TaxID=45792 RepID=UPI0034CD8CE8